MILDAAAISARMVDPPVDLRAYLLGFYPAADIPPIAHAVLTAEPLPARIVHGVWIASCPCGAPARTGVPTPGCAIWLDTPLAWCLRCGNQAVGRGWRPVAPPDPDERRRIEAVLDGRPEIVTRNWSPGETVADLITENMAHGCPVPDLEVP